MPETPDSTASDDPTTDDVDDTEDDDLEDGEAPADDGDLEKQLRRLGRVGRILLGRDPDADDDLDFDQEVVQTARRAKAMEQFGELVGRGVDLDLAAAATVRRLADMRQQRAARAFALGLEPVLGAAFVQVAMGQVLASTKDYDEAWEFFRGADVALLVRLAPVEAVSAGLKVGDPESIAVAEEIATHADDLDTARPRRAGRPVPRHGPPVARRRPGGAGPRPGDRRPRRALPCGAGQPGPLDPRAPVARPARRSDARRHGLPPGRLRARLPQPRRLHPDPRHAREPRPLPGGAVHRRARRRRADERPPGQREARAAPGRRRRRRAAGPRQPRLQPRRVRARGHLAAGVRLAHALDVQDGLRAALPPERAPDLHLVPHQPARSAHPRGDRLPQGARPDRLPRLDHRRHPAERGGRRLLQRLPHDHRRRGLPADRAGRRQPPDAGRGRGHPGLAGQADQVPHGADHAHGARAPQRRPGHRGPRRAGDPRQLPAQLHPAGDEPPAQLPAGHLARPRRPVPAHRGRRRPLRRPAQPQARQARLQPDPARDPGAAGPDLRPDPRRRPARAGLRPLARDHRRPGRQGEGAAGAAARTGGSRLRPRQGASSGSGSSTPAPRSRRPPRS